ncbi:ATP-dependent DNA helicase sgs1 [Puccinia graminis f. sp. tritici]|uniref:DNA 3'-5' helicase n=3 Tax=Puccinia graminis f. sp. tritici TaxID=56615 RepID=A0A5B0NMG5_PUCGR|nr:ATP-dependent DNA helicase sgs1 [Puccinia graminis f. sp. tritici]
MLRRVPAPAIRDPQGSNVRIAILKKISERNEEGLKAAISASALFHYRQAAKSQQIETVAHLVRGRNTFLLAGTGFGKSRIPEIYHRLLPKRSNGVILVLNPLDALGDNQVLEKVKAGFTAINLTQLTFNEEEANKIVEGVYNFVYLSPEIFMNSKLWDQVYYCPNFQKRLSLVVVDEAHIIYQWGLMESNGSKNKKTLIGKLEDIGIFRPSYGKLGGRLLTRNNKPILLMSATCRPIAIEEIKKSLKMADHNVSIVRAELTRPELHIIRLQTSKSLATCSDLIDLFPCQSDVPDASVVPTLIYTGTRNRTMEVMKALDVARGTPGRSMRPNSNFVRRFHACTGEKDKVKVVQDYADGVFPAISCTMALGMGQNWSRVRRVIQMGRADPSSICQMIGRCGRDGRAGLAIILVEKTRKGGKNCVDDFDQSKTQGHNNRMDALAITPVCLRIAFSIDNMLGYIPLSVEDPSYIAERAREKAAGFDICHCSNCMPNRAEGLIRNINMMNVANMDEFLLKDWPVESIGRPKTTKRKNAGCDANGTQKKLKLSKPLQDLLSLQLTTDFASLFDHIYTKPMLFTASDLFGEKEIQAIIKDFGKLDGISSIRKVIGGQMIPGQLEVLHNSILSFTQGAFLDEENSIQDRANRLKELEEQKEQERAEAQAQEAERKREAAKVAKAIEDRIAEVEAEKQAARKQVEDVWKAEQALHMVKLIQLAGEKAEREGLKSIHRGRYIGGSA